MKRVIGKTYRREGKQGERLYSIIQCDECGALTYERKANKIEQALSRKCRSCELHTENHGHCKNGTHSRTYKSWNGMKQRCYNINNPNWPEYGRRGIEVCERWKDSFLNFLEDMGERPEGTTLDRYPNVNGNYEPGNTRWATPKQQAEARRPSKAVFEAKGYRTLPNGKFQATIRIDGKDRNLGTYKTAEEAREAYKAARKAKYNF